MGVAVPKPVKREKKRKPLRRVTSLTPRTYAEARAQMIALRDRVRRRRLRLELNPRAVALVKRGTKHSRRLREWGRMSYAHDRRVCDVEQAFIAEFGMGRRAAVLFLCSGRFEYMHLHLEEGSGLRAPDHQGALGCRHHHNDIDGRNGRRAREWYVALGRDGQLRLRRRLVERQRARWDALTQEERDRWNERRDDAKPK